MSVGLKQSYDVEYNGTANVARMDLFVDTAADLTGLTSFDSITLLQGSTAKDISTGDEYMMKTDGTWVKQPSQSASGNVYTKAEIDSMLYLYYTKAEADALFEWATFTTATITTDTMPLTFIADGSPLTAWSISGNGQQTGTPTPDNQVMPEFVGTLSGSYWTLPITCAGQTTPVYLGQVQTVREIKKLILNGTEEWSKASTTLLNAFRIILNGYLREAVNVLVCTHYKGIAPIGDVTMLNNFDTALLLTASGNNYFYIRDDNYTTVEDFKTYLAAQYAAGTPVTVWYILATPETAIVNEPLCKIDTYADVLDSEDAAVTVPITRGENTLTIGTTLQPSEITVTGKIREVTENEQ